MLATRRSPLTSTLRAVLAKRPTALKKAIAPRWTRAAPKRARLSAAAKADAAKSTEQSVATADAAIATKVDAALASIGAAKAKAMGEIESVATEAVQGLVARVAGFDVDADAARVAVAKELVHG